jgi:hypothetical protein
MRASIWTKGSADETNGGRRRVERRMSVIIVSGKMNATIANEKTNAAIVVGPGLLEIVYGRLRRWLRAAGLGICLARRPERRDMSVRVLTVV